MPHGIFAAADSRTIVTRCQAQPPDTRRLQAKSERSSARRRRQTVQQRPRAPPERPQRPEENEDTQNAVYMWLEALEAEEEAADVERAAEGGGAAAAAPSAAPAEADPAAAAAVSDTAAGRRAAAARETELDAAYGAPMPQISGTEEEKAAYRERWERFLRETNPYEMPVRKVSLALHTDMNAPSSPLAACVHTGPAALMMGQLDLIHIIRLR